MSSRPSHSPLWKERLISRPYRCAGTCNNRDARVSGKRSLPSRPGNCHPPTLLTCITHTTPLHSWGISLGNFSSLSSPQPNTGSTNPTTAERERGGEREQRHDSSPFPLYASRTFPYSSFQLMLLVNLPWIKPSSTQTTASTVQIAYSASARVRYCTSL